MATQKTAPLPRQQAYAEFLTQLTSWLKTVATPAERLGSRIKLATLPGIGKPVESLQAEVQFAGAVCLFNFAQSAVNPDLYVLDVELHRPPHAALFLKDYAAQHRMPGMEHLRFRLAEHALEAGIRLQLDTVRPFLNVHLRSVLEGGPWITAPVDWGDYK